MKRRSFIPFFHDQAKKMTIYYDYKAQQFFKDHIGKQHPMMDILSGTTGVIIYALFKDIVINLGFNYPISGIVFSLLISCILAFGSIWGILYTMNKHLNQSKTIVTPSKEETIVFVREGEKWLKSTMILILFLFFIILVNSIILYFDSDNGLLFFTHTLMSAVLIILIWGIRPIKRRKIYKQFKKELERRQTLNG